MKTRIRKCNASMSCIKMDGKCLTFIFMSKMLNITKIEFENTAHQ